MIVPSDTLAAWALGWMHRTTRWFSVYTHFLLVLLTMLTLTYSYQTLLALRQRRETPKRLSDNPNNNTTTTTTTTTTADESRVFDLTMKQFAIAVVYFLHWMLLMLADGLISFFALGSSTVANASSEPFNLVLILWLVASTAFNLLLGCLATAAAPLAQIKVATWLLAWLSKPGGTSTNKEGLVILADYLAEARLAATYLMQAWAIVLFVFAAWVSPVLDSPVWPGVLGLSSSQLRTLVHQAAFGSAFAWFAVALGLCLCDGDEGGAGKRLSELPVEGQGPVGEVDRLLRLFGRVERQADRKVKEEGEDKSLTEVQEGMEEGECERDSA